MSLDAIIADKKKRNKKEGLNTAVSKVVGKGKAERAAKLANKRKLRTDDKATPMEVRAQHHMA